MRVAIVHDFLVQMGGAEKVLEVMHRMFPNAPVYTSLYHPEAMPAAYRDWDIRVSGLQRLPATRRAHRALLPLYPLAFESFDLAGYDCVLSSSSCFAKGVITPPETVHVCYTHAPMRFAWTTGRYVQNERISLPARLLLPPLMHSLRLWDAAAAARVDHYVANSSVVARRIAKYYRRESEIIFPPVETDRFALGAGAGDYYVLVARFAPYKRIDLAVEAFTRMGRRLKVAGGGRQMKALQRGAGPTVEFLGRVDDETRNRLYGEARGYIMPGEEDFGIAPVEANAAGCPVIAYAAGGALDSQIDGVTGILFPEQTVDSLCEAVQRAECTPWNRAAIQAHARGFDTEVFRARLANCIDRALETADRPRLRAVAQVRA